MNKKFSVKVYYRENERETRNPVLDPLRLNLLKETDPTEKRVKGQLKVG